MESAETLCKGWGMKVVLGLLVAALSVALAFVWASQASLREENRALQAQLERFTAPDAHSAPSLPANQAANMETNDVPELAKLRGEVLRLKQESAEAEKLRSEVQKLKTQHAEALNAVAAAHGGAKQDIPVPKVYRKEDWSFAGFGDPHSALRTLLWSASAGDMQNFMNAFTPERQEKMRNEDGGQTEAQLFEKTQKSISAIKSVQVLTEDATSNEEVTLRLFIDGDKEITGTPKFKFRRINNEWRLDGDD